MTAPKAATISVALDQLGQRIAGTPTALEFDSEVTELKQVIPGANLSNDFIMGYQLGLQVARVQAVEL